MGMAEEVWLRDGWEIPGSDDEMEYDLAKCIDSKLTACFDALTKQKTLKVSPALYGRPILASLQSEFDVNKDNLLINEPAKQHMDENESSIFEAFDYHEDKGPDNIRKRSYPTGAGRQQVNKKATLGNVMNNMMRHKRLENMGARPQMIKNNMYAQGGSGEPQFTAPIRHPRGSSVAQDITQNVMAQSRSINESMASLNMPRGAKNMPMTTPQPTPLGQTPQQGMEIPRSPNLSSPSAMFNNNVSQMSHVGQNMGPPNQTMLSANMMIRGVRPDQRTMAAAQQQAHYPMQHMGDASIQQQQQMYQRMAGMYKGPHGLTLVQGNNMGPRMVYNPVSGQTIMTTQHSGLMGPQSGGIMGNNVLVSRSGMMAPGGSMIPGMGPAPPNMSANMIQNQAAMVQNMSHKMLGPGQDNCQIVVSQAMHPAMLNNQSIVPNQTISNHPGHMPGGGMSRGPGPNILSPENKNKQLLNKMSAAHMLPPNLPMSPSTMVSPPNQAPSQMGPGGGPQMSAQRTPPSNSSPGGGDNSRDNITLNTAVAEPTDETMSTS